MPGYGSNSQAMLLRDNRQAFMWNGEAVATGTLSVAFQLERVNRTFYPWGLSVEVWFDGDPGVFEIDILGANSDIGSPAPGHYVQLGTISAVNSSFVGRWDMPSNLWPKYVCASIKTLTNSVNVSAQVTR